jgi:hypothetical protein
VQAYDKYWVRLDTDPINVVKRSADAGPATDNTESVVFPDSEYSDEIPVEVEDTESPTATARESSSTSTTTTTTTTSTTTTTTTTTTTEEAVSRYVPTEHDIFSGCGDQKACFGFNDNHENCIGQDNARCLAVVSYELDGNRWLFKMAGKTSGYLAVGLSFDSNMGDDLTTACYYSNGEVGVQSGYNEGKTNRPINPPMSDIESFKGSFEDGLLSCEFARPMKVRRKLIEDCTIRTYISPRLL